MKKLYTLILVFVVIVIAIGFYRGWFAISGARQPESNKVDISLTLDPDKVKLDAESVKEKTTELTEKIIEPEEQSREQRDADSKDP
jgi:hypothetical protein